MVVVTVVVVVVVVFEVKRALGPVVVEVFDPQFSMASLADVSEAEIFAYPIPTLAVPNWGSHVFVPFWSVHFV